MAIVKPPVSVPFADSVSDGLDDDLFEAPPFMAAGYSAPAGEPEIPALGHHNWLFNFGMRAGRYHNSVGLPEWAAAETEYRSGISIVWSSGNYYRLVGTATTGLAPEDDPFNWQPFGTLTIPEFGDGTDGDVTVSTSVSVNDRDRQYNNLIIESGGVLHVDLPFMVRVRGLLWIKAGGILRFGHLTELAGGAATGTGTGGVGGLGSNHNSQGSVGGGANGGQGGINTSGIDTDGLAFRVGKPGEALGRFRLGGAGGVGGVGGSAAGAGSSSTSFDLTSSDLLMAILAGGKGVCRDGTTTPKSAVAFTIQGGGGGGGGGGPSSLAPPDNKHEGGGGGAGASAGFVCAQRIVAEADGAFFAPGGVGGNSTNYGAGAGGGGGYVGAACVSFAGIPQTAAVCCPGGAAGTGGIGEATPGTAGGTGRIDIKTL